ncbi:NUDIX hydrolase [Aquipuribacter hungaricus]|uniref:NUDIX hydrolase n=1 Tax=Aquipuribacter hungaricus TaxID=545624 RepID=UPI003623E4D4
MTDTPKHSVSVAGVVVDDAGRTLAIQRRDNLAWEPPGGVLELGESFEDGVAREVLEETGLAVEVGTLTGAYKNMNRGIVALVFRCRPLTAPSPSTNEAVQCRWLSAREVSELMSEAYAVRVLDALSGTTHARAHDGVDLLPAEPDPLLGPPGAERRAL